MHDPTTTGNPTSDPADAGDRWASAVEIALDSDRERLRANALAVQGLKPDSYASADRLAKRYGWATAIVADDPSEFELHDRMSKLDVIHSEAPELAQWLTDPDHMALAQDDLDGLSKVAGAVRRTATASPMPEPSFVEEVISAAHAGFVRGKNYINTNLLDPLLPDLTAPSVRAAMGSDRTTEAAVRYASEERRAQGIERIGSETARQQQEIAAAHGWGEAATALLSNPRAVGLTVAQSLGMFAPGLAATAAGSTLGPGGTASAAGGASFALEYGSSISTAMQRAGVDETDPVSVRRFLSDPSKVAAAREYALRRGIPVALFDAATAGVSGRLIAGARGTVGSALVRSAGELGLQATGGAAGELSAELASGDPVSPSDVLAEAAAEIPSGVVEAGGNYRHARTLARTRAASDDARLIMDSATGAATLQEVTQAARDAKLAQRAPDALASFVAAAAPDGRVYLAADQARVLLQSSALDADTLVDELTGQTGALREAEATGGDVVFSLADFASKVATLPNAAEIVRHARLQADHLSASELANEAGLDERLAAWFGDTEHAAASAAPSEPSSAQRVEQDVLGMLLSTDRYRAADAELQAKLLGRIFDRLGTMSGQDPHALYSRYALRIANAPDAMSRMPDAIASSAPAEAGQDGAVLQQSARTMRIGEDTFTERGGRFYLTDARGQARDFVTLGAAQAEAKRLGAKVLVDDAIEGERPTWSVVAPESATRYAFRQGTESKPRGQLAIGADRAMSITLFDGADLSTFLHEGAHLFLEVMQDAAQESPAVAAELDTLRRWVGNDGEAFTTEQHEQVARGFESYLRDGNAPAPELRSVFARLRAWFMDLYRSASQLGVTLTDEVRGVFDRLLASEEEIEAAQVRQGISPIELAPEARALLTPKQWESYIAATEAATDEARQEVMSKVLQAHRREAEAWWKERRAAMREEVEDEFDALPAVRAWRILSGRKNYRGEAVADALQGIKLDRAALVDAYGEPWVKEKLLRLGVYRKAGGVSPDTAAAALGFPSGDALVRALAEVRELEARLDAETDRRMRERHSDPMTDGSLPEMAMAAVHGDARVAALEKELAILAELAHQPAPPARLIREYARRKVDALTIRAIRPNDYLVAERRAARETARAAAQGDYGLALRHGRARALNAALYSEARRAQDEADRLVRYARKLQEPAARKRLGLAGNGIREAVDEVLGAYGFQPASDRGRERARVLRDWYDRMVAGGVVPSVPASVLAQIEASRKTHFRDLSLAELRGVVDTIKQLDEAAATENHARLAGQKVEVELAASELAAQVMDSLTNSGTPPISQTVREKLPAMSRKAVRMAGAILLRLRTVAEWVDGAGNVQGPFHRLIVRPLDRAQTDYLDAMREYGERVIALFDEHLKGSDLSALVHVASIGQSLSRSDLIAIALNAGNTSNLQRLQDGFGWGPVQMREIFGQLAADDVAFVNAIHRTLESLWPKIAEQQRRLTGVEPPKIESQRHEFTGKDGAVLAIEGGYYPIMYDRESPQWQSVYGKDDDTFFDQMAMSALPANGYTKARVDQARIPLRLDLSGIPQHLSSILKDLTHRETVIGIRKITKRPEVVAAMTNTLGAEGLAMVNDKLKHVATDQVFQWSGSLRAAAKVSRGIRRNIGVMAMGYNVGTALKQILGFSNSLEVMTQRYGVRSPVRLAAGYMALIRGRGAAIETVRGLSGEMRHTLDNVDADVRNAYNLYLTGGMSKSAGAKVGRVWTAAQFHAFAVIRYAQGYLVNVPLWIAAHEAAQASGLSGDDAIASADGAVILAQGAAGAKDTALIEANIPGVELFTMFYSFFNAYLNRQITLGRDVGKALAGGPAQLFAELPLLSARFVYLSVLPVILEDLVSQAIGQAAGAGDEDDDGDEDAWDVAQYYAARVAAYQFAGLPVVRDLVHVGPYRYSATPLQSIGDALQRFADDVRKTAGGDAPEARKLAKDAVRAVGYTFGLPLGGPWNHLDYLWRVFEGEEEPESVPEFAAALATGKREER